MPVEALIQTTLVQEHKDNIIHTKVHKVLTWFDQMPTSMDERESFHHTIENITKDRIRYNYWVPKTSHVFPLFICTP